MGGNGEAVLFCGRARREGEGEGEGCRLRLKLVESIGGGGEVVKFRVFHCIGKICVGVGQR
jgi:hypothetical protein